MCEEQKIRDSAAAAGSAAQEVVHPVHTVRVILPFFLSAEGLHRPSVDMSDGIPNMGPLGARRPEIQAIPVDCSLCASHR